MSTNRKQKGMLVLSLLAFRILSVEPQPMRWSHPHGKRHTSTFRIVTNPKELEEGNSISRRFTTEHMYRQIKIDERDYILFAHGGGNLIKKDEARYRRSNREKVRLGMGKEENH